MHALYSVVLMLVVAADSVSSGSSHGASRHLQYGPCDDVCPVGTCDGPADAYKSECEQCCACQMGSACPWFDSDGDDSHGDDSVADDSVCGCEALGTSFCNYDGGSTGDCEPCSDFMEYADMYGMEPSADMCDYVSLPAAGAADCKKWCFSLESELSPSPSPLQSAPCCSEHGRRLLFGTVPKCDSSC